MGFLLLADRAGRTQNRTEHHTHHSDTHTHISYSPYPKMGFLIPHIQRWGFSPYPKMGFLLLADRAGRTQDRTPHPPLITQTHHSDSLITQTHSCSLITQTQSSLRLRRFARLSNLRGAAGGYFTGSRSRNFVGMSQAVWPFSDPTCFVFGADLEDVSGDSLVSAL